MWKRLAGWSGLLGVIFFVGEAVIGGWLLPDHSHLRRWISETYATGSPWSDVLRFGGVLPAGVLFMVFGCVLARAWRLPPAGVIGAVAFAFFYGLGTVVVALFPCDLGCDPAQIDPSLSHVLHFAAGAATYMFTPPALLLIGLASRQRSELAAFSTTALVAGSIMLAGVLMLFLAPVNGIQGLVQRVVEGAVMVILLHAVHQLLCGPRPNGRTEADA